jgi:hypothetical protein
MYWASSFLAFFPPLSLFLYSTLLNDALSVHFQVVVVEIFWCDFHWYVWSLGSLSLLPCRVKRLCYTLWKGRRVF